MKDMGEGYLKAREGDMRLSYLRSVGSVMHVLTNESQCMGSC